MARLKLTRELTKQEIAELKEAFDLTSTVVERWNRMNFGTSWAKLGEKPSDDELDNMIRAVDLNGDGEIDFEEFIGLMRLRMLLGVPRW